VPQQTTIARSREKSSSFDLTRGKFGDERFARGPNPAHPEEHNMNRLAVNTTASAARKPLVKRLIQSAVLIAAFASGAVSAQSMQAEGGTTATAGNTVSMTRIPVKTSTGAVLFKDIQIQFTVDNLGNTTMSAGFPKITTSPTPIPSSFKAGNYKDTLGNKYQVSGPAVIPGGRVMWRLNYLPPVGSGHRLEISWATGAVVGHPFQAQLTRHKITSALYTWGIVGALTFTNPFFLNVDEAVGVQQISNQLVFHLYNTPTSNVETGTATLTLCATTAC
jgi:hypothetical protein